MCFNSILKGCGIVHLFISDATEFVQGCPANGMYRFNRIKRMGNRSITLPNVVLVNL